MDARLLFPNNYIAAADLQEAEKKGKKEVVLTISQVRKEKLKTDRGDEIKPIIYFREMEQRHAKDADKENKRLVLNKTNARTIMGMHGNETDDWIGKKVALYATKCQAFGKQVDCVRVRDKAPK